MKIVINFGEEEHEIPLNTKEDFEQAVEDFPQLRESLYKDYHDLRHIAKDMAQYLSGHHIAARFED
jgi:hypothetical protein